MGIKGKKRLFLALWPDDEVREQLNAVLKKVGHLDSGASVNRDNLHMTLLFLGDVYEKDALNLITALDGISFLPFVLTINRWGHFHRPGILWLGATQNPEALNQLFKQIKGCITKYLNGVPIKSFKPHITLLRNSRTLPQVDDFEQIDWLIDSFVLVESKLKAEGVEYKVLKQWNT